MGFFRTIFENLFGSGENRHHSNQDNDDYRRYGDRFRNPIWQNDEEDDDDEDDDYRRNRNSPAFHFEVFTDPFEMTRYFESQMDHLLKDMFSFGFGGDSQMPFEGFRQIMPPESRVKSPRDEVLKPGYDLLPSDQQPVPSQLDEDLDGLIEPKDFAKIWGDEPSTSDRQVAIPNVAPSWRSFGQSIVSQTIRRPDGTIEERRTTKDSQGNTETVIKHRMGDKMHTVVITTDKNGVETKTENFENMDPNELAEFEKKKWKPIDEPLVKPGSLTQFPWHKFFDLK